MVSYSLLRLSQVCFFKSDYLWLSVFFIRSSFPLLEVVWCWLPFLVFLMLDSAGSPFSVSTVFFRKLLSRDPALLLPTDLTSVSGGTLSSHFRT